MPGSKRHSFDFRASGIGVAIATYPIGVVVGAITLLILSYPEGNLPMALFWGLWIPLIAVMAILRLSFFGYLIFFSVLIIILALASNKRVEFDVRFFLCSVLISIAWLTLDLYACVKLQEWM